MIPEWVAYSAVHRNLQIEFSPRIESIWYLSFSASTSKTPVEQDPASAKKQRVKQSLMKRARTVAMFSLKLKERRAREVREQSAKQAEQKAMEQMLRPDRVPGGELSCIPLEKLISVEDVAVDLQRRKNHNH